MLPFAGARASSVPATMLLVGPGLDAGLRRLPSLACGTGRLSLGLALLVVMEDAAPRGTLKGPREEERGPGGQLLGQPPPPLPRGRGPGHRCE